MSALGKSIVGNITLILTFFLALIVGAVISISISLSEQKTDQEIDAEARQTLAILVDTIRTPLWNYDHLGLKIIGDSYAHHDFIGNIHIADHLGETLYHW